MKKSITTQPGDDNGDFDLGTMLGRRQAFGTIAGRASAAEAECLRRMRDDKLFKSRASSWDEFCAHHLGMSRSNADRLIRLLEAFGPGYFEISQFTRITPKAYREIASAVRDQAIHINGEAIPLIAENAPRIQAAVTELRRAATVQPDGDTTPRDPLAALERLCEEVLREFARLIPITADDIIDRRGMASLIIMMRSRMSRLELQAAG